MLRIAICDDEIRLAEYLNKVVSNFFNAHSTQTNIEVYYSGENLAEALIKGIHFDIIFLDIEMGDMNGLEVGRILRRDVGNLDTLLFYVSGYEKYWKDICRLEPFGFIEKPIVVERIENDLEHALQRLNETNNKIFSFGIGRTMFRIPLNQIMYFIGRGHKFNIITTSVIHEFYSTMEEILKKLENSDFLNINCSVIVNPKFILEYDLETVKMVNQKILTISRSRRKEIREIYLEKEGEREYD